jgi:hypothetical protein
MSGNYFIHNLYPFQDSVLKLIMEVDDSDDLDLFVNRRDDFKELTEVIISRIKAYYPGTETALLGKDYARIFIVDSQHRLKTEFVNDVLFHAEDIQVAGFFHRIDSWQNILSNKVCALPRDEAKDLADLIYLSLNYSFTWETIIGYAREKDIWVNEIEVSQMVQKADTQRLKKIHWIKEPDYDQLQKICQVIAKDIIAGEENSFAREPLGL